MVEYKDRLYHQIIPIFCTEDVVVAKQVVCACYEGGIRVFEWANRQDSALAVYSQLQPWMQSQMPDMMSVVGSVTDAKTAKAYIDLGAEMIVSPILSSQVEDICRTHSVPYIPAGATPTEIFAASQRSEVVKVFPCQVLGADFVKKVLAAMPNLRLMVTGGVRMEDLDEWRKTGVWCIGMGSQLIDHTILQTKSWALLTERCRRCLYERTI